VQAGYWATLLEYYAKVLLAETATGTAENAIKRTMQAERIRGEKARRTEIAA